MAGVTAESWNQDSTNLGNLKFTDGIAQGLLGDGLVELTFTDVTDSAATSGGGTPSTNGNAGLKLLAAQEPISIVTNDQNNSFRIVAGKTEYAALSTAVRLVPSTMQNSTSLLPDGRYLVVHNGIAFELATTAADIDSFNSGVAFAGYVPMLRSDGGVAILISDNERMAAAFALSNVASTQACGYPSFTAPSGDPSAATYAFVMTCASGVSQRLTPLPDSPLFYTTLANSGLEVQTDRDTGIVSIETVGRFKPSFFATAPTAADTTYFNARKNADGVAFRARDVNGDGTMDYDVITADRIQVLYGVP